MIDASVSPPADVPLVFVADLEEPELAGDDLHHLERVMRLRPGAPITVSDGDGRWRGASFAPRPAPRTAVHFVDAATPGITIAFALVKGGRPELVTQKLTELGVDVVVPFVAARSVVRWDDARERRHVERLRRVAREAAMQSRRCRLPQVSEVERFETVVALPGAAAAERHGVPPTLRHPTVLVGPEGGWSAEERRHLPSRVGFGDLVLRADTAAITAGAILTALRSMLVAPVDRSE